MSTPENIKLIAESISEEYGEEFTTRAEFREHETGEAIRVLDILMDDGILNPEQHKYYSNRFMAGGIEEIAPEVAEGY